MRYRYAAPGPQEDPGDHTIVRPGDEREFDAEPAWGPWVEVGAPFEPPEVVVEPAPPPPAPKAAEPAAVPAAASVPAPPATPAPAKKVA